VYVRESCRLGRYRGIFLALPLRYRSCPALPPLRCGAHTVGFAGASAVHAARMIARRHRTLNHRVLRSFERRWVVLGSFHAPLTVGSRCGRCLYLVRFCLPFLCLPLLLLSSGRWRISVNDKQWRYGIRAELWFLLYGQTMPSSIAVSLPSLFFIRLRYFHLAHAYGNGHTVRCVRTGTAFCRPLQHTSPFITYLHLYSSSLFAEPAGCVLRLRALR